MFARLLSRLRRRHREARVPEGTRVYAIGDVHGCAELLAQLHGMIRRDILNFSGERLVAVYLGDYVDRGLRSREVIDMLLDDPLPGFESVYLRGNHERTLLEFLVNADVALDWIAYGGDATLYSYGVGLDGPRTSDGTLVRAQRKFDANLPARHRDFFASLAMNHVEGDYFFVHAGVRPGIALDQQGENDMLWIREDFTRSEADFGKVVVHGHTITTEPEARVNRIGVDTGAFVSGRLTSVVLEGTGRRFLQT